MKDINMSYDDQRIAALEAEVTKLNYRACQREISETNVRDILDIIEGLRDEIKSLKRRFKKHVRH